MSSRAGRAAPRFAQSAPQPPDSASRAAASCRSSSSICSPAASIAASCARICCSERSKRVRLNAMLAREATDVEQARFGLLQPLGIERQRVGGARDPVLGLARLDQRAVERGEGFAEQRMVGGSRSIRRAACRSMRERPFRTAQQFIEPAERFAGLTPACIAARSSARRVSSPSSGASDFDFGRRMREPFTVAFGGGELGARLSSSASIRTTSSPRCLDLAEVESSESIEQRAVALRVEQPAIIVLSVDLDREAADIPKESGRHARAAEEGAASAVAFQHASERSAARPASSSIPCSPSSQWTAWSDGSSISAETSCQFRARSEPVRRRHERPARAQAHRAGSICLRRFRR